MLEPGPHQGPTLKSFMRGFLCLLGVLLVNTIVNSTNVSNSLVAEAKGASGADCTQSPKEQQSIIRESEKGAFTLRRLELIGNVTTPDEVLHRSIASRIAEGSVFKRSNLIAALRNVRKIRTISPVTMKDVVLRLDRDERSLDIRICVEENSSQYDKLHG